MVDVEEYVPSKKEMMTDEDRKNQDANVTEAFQLYQTGKYLETVYPKDFDLEKLKPAIDEIMAIFSDPNSDRKINVGELCKKHNIERIVDAENICLLAFNSRVARFFLEKYPKGNASSIEIDGGGTFIGPGTSSLISNITLSEYLEKGKEESEKWLNSTEENAHNWDEYLRFIQISLRDNPEIKSLLELRLKSEDKEVRHQAALVQSVLNGDIKKYKELIKNKISPEILKGDIFKPEFFPKSYDIATASNRQNAYDFVTTNFTSESATDKRFSWMRGMLNVMNAVKDGGHLVLTACLETNYYMVGDKRMPATPVKGEEIRAILEKRGFNVIEHRETFQNEESSLGYQKLGFFLAEKKQLTQG